jgi:hypothetical protein
MGDILAKPRFFAAATAVFVVFAFTVLPAKAADAALYTPPGASFDTSLFYTPAQAIERAFSYGEEGRAAYIFDRWTFDLAFPLVYGIFMLSAWAFSIKRLASGAGQAKPAYSWLLVPALGIAFDFVENTAVTLLMLGVGSSGLESAARGGALGGVALGTTLGASPWLQAAAVGSSAATALKWLFVSAGFAGALTLPLAAGIAALARGRRGARPKGRGPSSS